MKRVLQYWQTTNIVMETLQCHCWFGGMSTPWISFRYLLKSVIKWNILFVKIYLFRHKRINSPWPHDTLHQTNCFWLLDILLEILWGFNFQKSIMVNWTASFFEDNRVKTFTSYYEKHDLTLLTWIYSLNNIEGHWVKGSFWSTFNSTLRLLQLSAVSKSDHGL